MSAAPGAETARSKGRGSARPKTLTWLMVLTLWPALSWLMCANVTFVRNSRDMRVMLGLGAGIWCGAAPVLALLSWLAISGRRWAFPPAFVGYGALAGVQIVFAFHELVGRGEPAEAAAMAAGALLPAACIAMLERLRRQTRPEPVRNPGAGAE